jgi:hypothetical protein
VLASAQRRIGKLKAGKRGVGGKRNVGATS